MSSKTGRRNDRGEMSGWNVRGDVWGMAFVSPMDRGPEMTL